MALTLLKDMYLYFTLIIGAVSLLYFRYIRDNIMGTLPFYMFITTWLTIVILKYLPSGGSNAILTNMVVIPIEYFYFFVFFHFISPKGKTGYLTLICSVVYTITLALDILVFKKNYIFLFLFSYITGTIILLVLVTLYLYRLLNSDNLLRFYKMPGFWVSTGVLLFYIGSIPLHLFWNSLKNDHPAFITTRYIFYILLLFMYIGFTLAIICTKWANKK